MDFYVALATDCKRPPRISNLAFDMEGCTYTHVSIWIRSMNPVFVSSTSWWSPLTTQLFSLWYCLRALQQGNFWITPNGLTSSQCTTSAHPSSVSTTSLANSYRWVKSSSPPETYIGWLWVPQHKLFCFSEQTAMHHTPFAPKHSQCLITLLISISSTVWNCCSGL